ncbi:hypothetical protein FOZ63_011015 [Perkinsus olseni]|uniref:Uncharacterized protein n=1 Tax=Perkinsus olseni TaxID=32597 RepID=A0A7J6TJU4_PEROL|nr:hypothetical protein FOZ63_011015 [Perkinsus olseni]
MRGSKQALRHDMTDVSDREGVKVTDRVYQIDLSGFFAPARWNSAESMSNASVVTLTYEANKLYCKILGNCLVYFNVPEPVADYPERKVGWGKISVMIREMSRREEECEFGVSIDTDAYFRTRENLDNIVEDFELDGFKLVGIAEEFHQEELEFEDPFSRGHAIGSFFIVRNNEEGRRILRDWWAIRLGGASDKLRSSLSKYNGR